MFTKIALKLKCSLFEGISNDEIAIDMRHTYVNYSWKKIEKKDRKKKIEKKR